MIYLIFFQILQKLLKEKLQKHTRRECPFITITSRFILAQCGSTWKGPI